MIRSAISYTRDLGTALVDPAARRLLWAHAGGVTQKTVDREAALTAAVGYLLRAQQQGTDAGLGSYHLTKGWGASYPETTGYAIPTLFVAGDRLGRSDLHEAAVKAADWLLTIQRVDGGWQGGRIGEDRQSVVFNTAQVVRGLLAAHARTQRSVYLDAAVRAGRWMAEVQDPDGAWRAANFMGVARVYDTYVDAPLLQLHAVTGDGLFRTAAVRNLEWVLRQQRSNGWFANADNTLRHNDRPITHTLAYTMDGLLECARITGEERWAQAALKAAEPLAERYLVHGALRGRYDATWKGSEHPILTGCAQMAIVWSHAAELVSDQRYRTAAEGMLNWLISVQDLGRSGPDQAFGALPGSFPLWGRYEKFAFPNWGTKYFVDALLCAGRDMAR
ncbi:MAG: prenyltransferase/squalene oxidase repeat-containing protein [Flavobacteriales bacterium]